MTNNIDVHSRDDIGQTLLHHASKSAPRPGDRIPTIHKLIESGSEVNARDQWGRTPLFYAAANDRGDAAEALIAAGADVNARDNVERTALHAAAARGSVSVAKLLLEAGAEVDPADNREETPLLKATLAKSGAPEEVIKLLREKGANPWNPCGWESPLTSARASSGGYHFQEIKEAFADLPDEEPK